MSSRRSNDDNEPLIPSPQRKIGQAQLTLAPRDSAPPPAVSQLSPLLLDDVMVEILLRLPVKFLVQLRCICKSWKCLISDPRFVKEHLHRSTMDTSFTNYRLAMCAEFELIGDGFITCSLQSLFRNQSTPIDVRHQMRSRCRVVGSCNGLLCLYDYIHRCVRLWNPSTRWISENSPNLGGYWRDELSISILFGFGYDHCNDDYKVVAVFPNIHAKEVSQKAMVKVYTLGAKSWRHIQSLPGVPSNYESGKWVDGTINWLAETRTDGSYFPFIVSLDLGKETCREVLLPDYGDDDDTFYTMLGVLRGCLCFSYALEMTDLVVWLMKEYGVEESWTKLATIPYVDLGVSKFLFPKPLFMSENDEILVEIKLHKFGLYNPRDNTLNQLEIETQWCLLNPSVYIESLASPSCC